MKILQVIHSVNPQAGGTTEGLKQFSAALGREGLGVDVLCLDAPEAPWLHDFPLPLFALGPGRSSYGYTPRLLPWLREHARDYDAIVVNGLWQYGSLAVWRASRTTGVPYLVFPHGMLDPWFKRQYPLKHAKKWLYWPWAEYRVLRDARAVLFTTEEERLDARKSFWLYRCREEVVGYGIDPPPSREKIPAGLLVQRFPKLAGKRLLLFLGRMHVKKGCDLLLNAFAEMTKKEAARDVHLVMAGPLDHEYARQMQQLAQDLGISGRVTWTGMLSGEMKWSAFYSASAFVLPSHQENFGISAVEALACGVPVLLSNKVNIWREIEASGAGWIGNDDLPGTREILDGWLQNPASGLQARSEAATKCFQVHFQMTSVAARFVSLM